MTPIVTFETIVPGGFAPRRTTCDAAGTPAMWAGRCSEPVSARTSFNWSVVPVVGRKVLFPDGVGALRATDYTGASSSLQFARASANFPHSPGYYHLNGILKANKPGVMGGVRDYANPHRIRGMLGGVPQRRRGGERS
jgi:hypothetical protein